jgi:SCY1-like protein 1
VIIKLFASTDRAIRIALCENLSQIIEHLDSKTVCDKIFPNLATGFNDTSPVIREHTLKTILVIIGKLTQKVINNELLKYLAKLQSDAEPGIRTNTTICIGKISKYLSEDTKKKVFVSAFTRSLQDPFPPSRNAGLLALSGFSYFLMI